MILFNANLKIEAQSNLCDDIPYNVSVYQNFGITQSAPPISTTTIKVYFMVYRDNDGANGVSNQRLQDIMDRLNTNYQSAGFAFVWRLCETIYTNDTELNNSTNSCIFEEIHTDGLNIHVRGDSKPHRARVNSIPGTVVFVGGTFTINQNSTFIGDVPSATNSIVHEVGHCLGLFHTHHGSCASEVPTSMCPSDINSMISSNGDMVDDTPRDPNLEEKMIINSCTWNEDKCEDNMNIPITNPLTNNFMSYTRPTCMTSFTAGQITRMQALCPSNIKYNGPAGVPTLSGDEVSNQCPVRAFDLNTLVNSLLPCGAEVRWSTDSGPLNSISPIVSNLVSQTGFYYAYYYYADENSYGPASQPVYFFKNKCCGDLEDLIITSNTDIIQNQDMGNIKVKSGYTLTIKSKLQFAEDKGIEVEYGAKLIIDGGTLTKCPLVASWKGIKVQADFSYIWGFGQPTTEVIVKNAGSIEYAYIAINAVSQITFFTTTDIGGAKITINGNSIISHCHIGLKLGPIYGLNDLSSIDHAIISNNDKAILLSGNNGLKVSNSVFDHNAIDVEAVTSSLKADNNDFNGEVVFINTFPNFNGSTFINNRFYDGGVGGSGILLDAFSNATDFNIHNNQFFDTGVFSLGELDFDIQGNDFHGSPQGTWINDSGSEITNDIHQNKFYDNAYGNSASGVNSAEYFKNCFENTANLSIEVNEASSIGLQQGSDQDAAGNCFFSSGPVGTGQTSEFFDYYVKQGEVPQSCKKPGIGNFYELQAFADILITCGTGINIYGTLPYIMRNCMYGNGISLQQAISLLRAELLRIQNATNINPWTKRWLIAKYKKCLDRLIKQKAKSDGDQNGKETAIQFLLTQPEFRYQSIAYGLVAETGNMTRARTMLSNLNPIDAGETEFVQSQHTLLDYFSDRTGYNPSSATLSSLYSAGLRKHPLAGFSRSIYYTLTGQKVPVTLTHLSGSSQTRIKEAANESFFYPNPSYDGDLVIDIPNYDINYEYSYSITSTSDGVVNKGTLNQKVNGLSLDLSSGLYIVTLLKDGKPLLNQKWIVIR